MDHICQEKVGKRDKRDCVQENQSEEKRRDQDKRQADKRNGERERKRGKYEIYYTFKMIPKLKQ